MVPAEAIRAGPRVTLSLTPTEVGDARPTQPPLAVLGVATPQWVRRVGPTPTWPPPAAARGRDFPEDTALYVLWITHRSQLADLPGLDELDAAGHPAPSRVRDAVDLALAGGTPSVEVALAVGPGAVPWSLAPEEADPHFLHLYRRYLEDRWPSLVALPDAGGPSPLARVGAGRSSSALVPDPAEAAKRWTRDVAALSDLFSAWRHVGVVDAPTGLSRAEVDRCLSPLLGRDLAICAWSGQGDALRAQGWRPACAAVAAALGGVADEPGRVSGLSGRRLTLGRGRQGPTVAARVDALDTHVLRLELEPGGEQARITRDPCLRRPLGSWTLTALWAARQVVRRVEEIASGFVFNPASPASATELQLALLRGLGSFIRSGALTGPEGGEPTVEAFAPPDRGQPRLEAILDAVLRPWVVEVHVEVEIGLNQSPTVRLG